MIAATRLTNNTDDEKQRTLGVMMGWTAWSDDVPDFPDVCGTVYIGDLIVLMTQPLTDILNGRVSAGAALRDAATQVNACMAWAQ